MSAADTPQSSPSEQTPIEVMFFDTDCGGVVHNIAYLRFIETCRTKLAAQLGLDLCAMMEEQTFAVVLRTEIDYRKPARLGEHLVVDGRLSSIAGVRFWCDFEIRRPLEEALLVTSRQALALVQLPAGRPLRLPGAWRMQWPHLAR